MRTFAAWFGIIVGVSMLLMWAMFIATGQVPELETEPLRIAFHLAGEGLTAMTLLVAGVGLARGSIWARDTYLVACGMLLYTAMVSPGYYAQLGTWGFVGMFGAIAAGTLIALGAVRRAT